MVLVSYSTTEAGLNHFNAGLIQYSDPNFTLGETSNKAFFIIFSVQRNVLSNFRPLVLSPSSSFNSCQQLDSCVNGHVINRSCGNSCSNSSGFERPFLAVHAQSTVEFSGGSGSRRRTGLLKLFVSLMTSHLKV